MEPADVRFGSKADMAIMRRDVRFTPNSGHAKADICSAKEHVRFTPESGHWQPSLNVAKVQKLKALAEQIMSISSSADTGGVSARLLCAKSGSRDLIR